MKILYYFHNECLVSFFKHGLVFFLCIFSFFAPGCNEDKKHDLKTFPVEFTEGDFSLDSLASDLVIIPLDFGEITVSQVMDVKWHDPYLYICSAEGTSVGRLSLFNLDGKLINTMDRSGRGPGEYLSIQQFGVDDNGTIYINTWHKVVVFDRQLNHVRDIRWPDDLNFAEMYFHEDNIFLFSKSVGKPPKYDWLILDTSGNVISTKPFNCYPEISYPPPFPLVIFKSNNKLYRYRSISDTIFKVGIDDYSPEYFVKRQYADGYRNYTKEEISKNTRWDRLMQSMHDVKLRYIEFIDAIDSCWIISYRTHIKKNVKFETAIYDQKNEKITLINRCNIEIDKPILWGIPNDWVGYGTIKPEGVAKINNKNYIISFMDAVRLKDMVNSNGFRNSVPQRPEIKQKFQEIADTLTINDNPVLILLELK